MLGSLFLGLLFSAGVDYSGPLWSYLFPISAMFMLGKKKGLYFVLGYLFLAVVVLFIASSSEIYSFSFKLRFMGSFLATLVVSYYIEYIREVMHGILVEKNSALAESLNKLEKKDYQLVEKELYYRTLFESAEDAIFIMDGDLFVECNPKTLDMFNCKREDIINKSPVIFSPEIQHNGRLSTDMAMEKIKLAQAGNPQFFEWIHKRLDGRFFNAEVSLVQIKLENTNLIQATVRDITNRKMVEEELLLAKERAERSDMLKSDFLAQMSHEIRTPINTIMNYTSLLKMEVEENVSEDNKGSFASIQNAAHRLLRTIDLILNISDLEAGTYDPKFELIDLENQIIIPVVNEFKQAAQNKNLALIFQNSLSKKALTIIDSYTVYQSIANLVDNAVKYTENGFIQVTLDKIEESFVIKISDSGVGISKNYIPKLFEKFTQEEEGYTRRYEGSGLGLALVKNYCTINNIHLSVESEKGKGTTFILEIPIETK
ncbi:MAG: PAS domain-containing sensor histidine kinase [Melioribacteraceae bacterium]|nr:PAS domain-containing sensor histidine kinase [Melioribacteraceae bacterium]